MRLIEQLQKFPGIGAKSAQRLAFHVLKASREDAERLADALRDVKNDVHHCSICSATGEVVEVILATNPTVEGEATALYLSKLLKPLGVRVTRIGMGVPVGSDLEYADEVTMTRALEGRREM